MARNKKIHDYDVGFQILDLTGVEFEEDGEGGYQATLPGAFETIKKSNGKPILVKNAGCIPIFSGLDFMGDIYLSFGIGSKEGENFASAYLPNATSFDIVEGEPDSIYVYQYSTSAAMNVDESNPDDISATFTGYGLTGDNMSPVLIRIAENKLQVTIGEASIIISGDDEE